MIELDKQVDKVVDIALLERIAQQLSPQEIELMLVDGATMQAINLETRELDKSTDVLSFPMVEMPGAPLGSIVISEDHVSAGAKQFGHTEDDERALLFIHGMLHILGYDHEVDSGEMRVKEAELINRFELPQSLIVRTEGS